MSEEGLSRYVFPPSLVSRADISRLARELENLENEVEAQRVRGAEKAGYHLPAFSTPFAEFLDQNKLDVTDAQTRMHLTRDLRALKDKTPIIHLTFATDANPVILQQLTEWIREQIHPQALLSIGLQPGLVGGVYVRTPNKVHDFSFKAMLEEKHSVMLKELDGLNGR